MFLGRASCLACNSHPFMANVLIFSHLLDSFPHLFFADATIFRYPGSLNYCSLHFDDISHTRHFSLAMSISLFYFEKKAKYSAIVTSFKGENLKSTHFHNEKSFASHGLIFFPCLSFIKLKIRQSPQNMD